MKPPPVVVVLAIVVTSGCERPPISQSANGKADLPIPSKLKVTIEEPKLEDLLGVWQPDKGTLTDLHSREGTSKMVELVLRRNGTCLLQGVPAKWINEGERVMPVRADSAGGTWILRKNWEGWEIRLEAPERASLVLALRGAQPPYTIIVPCADSSGSFQVMLNRTQLTE